jgi:M6 family metalloprotease-like protein
MRNAFLSICIIALAAGAALAVVAPKDGGSLPLNMRKRMAKDPTTFRMQHAWIHKAQRAKAAREAYLASLRASGGASAAASAALRTEHRVAGTVAVPVFAGYFATQSAPYAIANLSNRLFDDPSGTITDYYDEVSFGALNMTGTVYGWTQVSQNDTYYEGPNNGSDPSTDRTGEFMQELLDAYDGSVDFGQYDNDGPDGVPNSADDDGFVDFVAFVHNETGGECTNGASGNIWSHSWSYSVWPNAAFQPYQTNDAAFGGGVIQIQDYVIQPAVNCSGGTVIDIGVFCHEFGHALGLPDLYDTWPFDGTDGNGIGHWGIMGSGNWNTPSSPAHPCAWTREEMGWIVPTDVDWTNANLGIPNVNQNGDQSGAVYRLPFSDDRFRRSTACTITGAYSLYCGLTVAEGTARGWVAPGTGGGYGALWNETVAHDFSWDGSAGPVTFTYKYDYDLEDAYDFAYAVIEVNGSETVLAPLYTGTGAGTENINVAPYLTPLGSGGDYTLKFRVVSDYSFSDDDGFYDSSCGALIVDDVSLTGGGEAYATGFETFLDGWYQDPAENPSREYWLLENRQAIGFDANLHNTGVLIWHVDQEVMHAPFLGNDAPLGNVRGVVLEEADGLFNLNVGTINRGEPSDPFPGTLNRTQYDSLTTPNSNDNANRATHIQVTSISASASTMTANLRAGDPPPQAGGIVPNNIDNDLVAVDVDVSGGFMRHGATFRLEYAGTLARPSDPQDSADIVPVALEWVDYARVRGTINVYSKTAGPWDLVVVNPDGQESRLASAVTINFIVAVQLVSAALDVVEDGVRVAYVLRSQEPDETIRLHRSLAPGDDWQLVADDLRAVDGTYAHIDRGVEPGRTYHYRLTAHPGDGSIRELHRGSVTVPAGDLVLEQNVPNPFNPSTTIRFYLPARARVRLDVFDVSGALVARVAEGVYDAGAHRATWDGTDARGSRVGSGVYLYRLRAGTRALTRKMIVVK